MQIVYIAFQRNKFHLIKNSYIHTQIWEDTLLLLLPKIAISKESFWRFVCRCFSINPSLTQIIYKCVCDLGKFLHIEMRVVVRDEMENLYKAGIFGYRSQSVQQLFTKQSKKFLRLTKIYTRKMNIYVQIFFFPPSPTISLSLLSLSQWVLKKKKKRNKNSVNIFITKCYY